MSRIDDLIAEHCPDGVSFKALGDFAHMVRGNGMPKVDLTDSGIGAIHYGQIYTRYGVWTNTTFSFVTPETAAKLVKAETGDIIITNTSENIEDVGKAVAWLGQDPIVTGGHATVIKHREDPKYLAYWFQSESFLVQKKALATGTKVIDVSAKQLMKVRVPVPPLEVQREIVRILDQFTQLEAELEAELEARRTQYQHYREVILWAGSSGMRQVELHEVADITVGFPFKSSRFSDDPADVPLVRGDNVGQGSLKNQAFKRWKRSPNDELGGYELRPGDVVLAMDRPWIPAGLKWARIGDALGPALLVQRVARLRSHPNVLDQRFLGSMISSSAFTEHVLRVQTGNTVPHISGKQIGSFRFPLPPLELQSEHAAALDNFDALVNDLSVGLPAELAARRKQYEYYRDKLLTFKEAAA